jgi:hypothetical protein
MGMNPLAFWADVYLSRVDQGDKEDQAAAYADRSLAHLMARLEEALRGQAGVERARKCH